MRKSLLILALLFAAAMASPNAYADDILDASFTCTTACVDVPVDPPVTFPSPTIPISFFNQSFNITLNGLDQATDSFTWGVGTNTNSWYFQITDTTIGLFDTGPSYAIGGSGTPYGRGSVYFTWGSSPAPEPSSGMMMLFGVALAFLAWKLSGNARPRSL